MFAEPAGLDRGQLVRTLRAACRIRAAVLDYAPVGFGTHHYRVRDATGGMWFVNVDDVATKSWLGSHAPEVVRGLDRALGTASGAAVAAARGGAGPVRGAPELFDEFTLT